MYFNGVFRQIFEKLKNWKINKGRKPLVFNGARQVGKTYIVNEFGKREFVNFHHFNFEKDPKLKRFFEEDLDPTRILRELSLEKGQSFDLERDLFFFDEIQACPNAITALKYFSEDLPGVAIIAAGSLLGLELTPASFPVGKVNFLTLYPLNFEEFLIASEQTQLIEFLDEKINNIPIAAHQRLWKQLQYYFITGGLPEVVTTWLSLQNDFWLALNSVRIRQEELCLAYLADMAKHCGKENAMHLERVFSNIPLQITKEQTGEVKRFRFKNVIPGLKSYEEFAGVIDWLKTAGLLIRIPIIEQATHPLRAHVQENIFKLLMFDIGILGALARISPKAILDYDYGSYKGYFAENFVAQELLAKGEECFSWREKNNEIEFLVDSEGCSIPIEVKAGKFHHSKSLKNFVIQYKPRRNFVLCCENLEYHRFRYPLYLAGKLPLKGD